MSRDDDVQKWQIAKRVYLIWLTRLVAAAWAIGALGILDSNHWSFASFIGVAVGSLLAGAVIAFGLVVFADAQAIYPERTPPTWAQDIFERRGK